MIEAAPRTVSGWLFAVGLVAVVAVLTLAGGSAPAEATDHCPRPGGADVSFVPSADLVSGDHALRIVGGGFGHAIGMSQYGAEGAAHLGCSYRTVLQTYYRGTTLEDQEMPAKVRVGFLQDVSRVYVTAEEGPIPWDCVSGACEDDDQPPSQPQGATWEVRATSSGTYVIRDGKDGDEVWRGGTDGLLRAAHEGKVIRVTDRDPGEESPGFSRRVKWGFQQISTHDTEKVRMYAVQHVTSGDGHLGMERYLWGIAEVPSSWPMEALKAQVVAARTYAAIRIGLVTQWNVCRCDLWTDTRHQNYTGWAKESEGDDGRWGKRWKEAVNAVTGQVLVHPDSDRSDGLADSFYSSSHGGWGENSEDVWSGEIAWLRAVDTSRWEAASSNPYQRWEKGFSETELEQRFDLDEFTSFRVRDRGEGGRPVSARGTRQAGAEVRGVKDGAVVTRRYSGEQLRWTLGVRSGLVFEAARRATPLSRHDGDNRVGTAIAVSAAGWDRSPTVVVARADDHADALAGTGLAGQLDAPLLITPRDHLASTVADEVERLDASRAVLLGGEEALGPDVEEGLRDAGVTVVDRVHGDNRVGTAAAVADELDTSPDGKALLVFGSGARPDAGWPDALSVAGVAARRAAGGDPWPILLTGDSLPDATVDALERHDVSAVDIVGGTAVVPLSVEQELRDLGYSVRRLAGADRYGTSRVVVASDGARGPVIAVTGRNFPDGLAAGAYAARVDGSILLVRSDTLDAPTGHRKWIREEITRFPSLVVVGGTSAVGDAVVAPLRAELRVR